MQPEKVYSILGIGDKFDCVLFKIAILFAENGFHVWFISPETFEKTPKDIKTPDKEVLQLITFMYLKDYQDLVTQLNGIHLWRKIPDVIIVTGFHHYCKLYTSEYKPVTAALVATCLLNSAAVCAVKKNKNIKLLVTCLEPTEMDTEKLQILRDLYFKDCVYKISDNEFHNQIVQLCG